MTDNPFDDDFKFDETLTEKAPLPESWQFVSIYLETGLRTAMKAVTRNPEDYEAKAVLAALMKAMDAFYEHYANTRLKSIAAQIDDIEPGSLLDDGIE